MTTRRRLALVWLATLVELSIVGVLIARVMCPTRLAFEKLHGMPTDSVLPALRGEARCWVLFLFLTVVSVGVAALASVSVTRRAQMAS